jgi:hypothetical protein
MPQENIHEYQGNEKKHIHPVLDIYVYQWKEKKKPTVELSPFLLDIQCDSLSDLKIHQYAGHNVFAPSQDIEEIGTVCCEDEALRVSLDGNVDGFGECYRWRPEFRIIWCIAQDNFSGDVARSRRFRVASARKF